MPVELEPEALQSVDKALRLINEADELLRKAVACGFDCQAQQMLSLALRQRLDSIKAQFGPGRRE